MDVETEADKGKLADFFRDIADVMARHPEVARRFVLAERDPIEEVEEPGGMDFALIGDPATDGATRFLRAQAVPRRKICVKFGIDPQTGQRICLKWVDEG